MEYEHTSFNKAYRGERGRPKRFNILEERHHIATIKPDGSTMIREQRDVKSLIHVRKREVRDVPNLRQRLKHA